MIAPVRRETAIRHVAKAAADLAEATAAEDAARARLRRAIREARSIEDRRERPTLEELSGASGLTVGRVHQIETET